jgi:hypothetical protein
MTALCSLSPLSMFDTLIQNVVGRILGFLIRALSGRYEAGILAILSRLETFLCKLLYHTSTYLER